MNKMYNVMLYGYTYLDVLAFHLDNAVSERWTAFRERRAACGKR